MLQNIPIVGWAMPTNSWHHLVLFGGHCLPYVIMVEFTGGYFQLLYLHYNRFCMLMHCCEPLQDTYATRG